MIQRSSTTLDKYPEAKTNYILFFIKKQSFLPKTNILPHVGYVLRWNNEHPDAEAQDWKQNLYR